ncbi:Hypothetical predicted protein, partial [Paramuricea clavata]
LHVGFLGNRMVKHARGLTRTTSRSPHGGLSLKHTSSVILHALTTQENVDGVFLAYMLVPRSEVQTFRVQQPIEEIPNIVAQTNMSVQYMSVQYMSVQYGVYMINPGNEGAFSVYCDQTTDGGGWTVFQRRMDGAVDFYRTWDEYANGFGDLFQEHWLGNENLLRITNVFYSDLRIDLESFSGETSYITYAHDEELDVERMHLCFVNKYGSYFKGRIHKVYISDKGDGLLSKDVDPDGNGSVMVYCDQEKYEYQESLWSSKRFSFSNRNCLYYLNGKPFTTYDRDNDDEDSGNCATDREGAWWFGSCGVYNQYLNGVEIKIRTKDAQVAVQGVKW